MTHPQTSREKLQSAAKSHFWRQGYSSVSLRDIAQDAGVDVALVSRHFGSKLGLFEATLIEFEGELFQGVENKDQLKQFLLAMFAEGLHADDQPSALHMVILNAADPEVGEVIRERLEDIWQKPLRRIVGDRDIAAQISSVVFGASLTSKILNISDMPETCGPQIQAQLNTLLSAVLA